MVRAVLELENKCFFWGTGLRFRVSVVGLRDLESQDVGDMDALVENAAQS